MRLIIFVEGAAPLPIQGRRLSAAGIPQITVCHGSSTAGGAYQPGLIGLRGGGVRGKARMFLAGPRCFKASDRRNRTDEELVARNARLEVAATARVSRLKTDADWRFAPGPRYTLPVCRGLSSCRPREIDLQEPLYDAKSQLLGWVPF